MGAFKKSISRFLTLIFVFTLCAETFAAEKLPYITYNYDYREFVVYTPAAYVPERSVSGQSAGTSAFLNPQGMCADDTGEGEGNIYVADTGNNRIVILNPDMTETLGVLDSFDNNGVTDTFNGPFGVFVSGGNDVYIADTGNLRVVVLSDTGSGYELKYIIENPQSDVLPANFAFAPLRVAVDYADRVYCVSRNMFQGLMVFENGEFTGFFGTIEVSVTAWEKFWRFFSTQEERRNQALFIPTEFTGIDIDKEGFVYASHLSPDGTGKQAVRRLNPRGEDVVKKGVNEHVGGDIQLGSIYSIYSGPSNFIDITVRDRGVYSLLDSRRGRIVTYDYEGNILYIFGGLGSQAGTFRLPSAIATSGQKVLVLDSYRGEIQLFKETNYGRLINEAVALRFDGDEALAVEKWRQVLKYDENFELANSGIGKSFLTAGDNRSAMEHLKLGMNRDYLSIAFKRYRNDLLKNNLSAVLTGLLAVVIALIIRAVSKKLRSKDDEGGVWGD